MSLSSTFGLYESFRQAIFATPCAIRISTPSIPPSVTHDPREITRGGRRIPWNRDRSREYKGSVQNTKVKNRALDIFAVSLYPHSPNAKPPRGASRGPRIPAKHLARIKGPWNRDLEYEVWYVKNFAQNIKTKLNFGGIFPPNMAGMGVYGRINGGMI